MCDFAADADAAQQLLVGRVLTVKRVKELNAKDYAHMRPGLHQAPWGLEVSVTDPFSNRITFCEREIKG